MAARKAYAKGTRVAVAETKAKLELLLEDHGATAFMAGSGNGQAFVAFQLLGRNVKLTVPMPSPDDRAYTHKRVNMHSDRKLSESDAHARWRQGCAERWRAVLLLVRAKLEAIELGQSTVDREFLHDMLIGDPRQGRTFGEALAAGELDEVLGEPGVPLLPAPRGA